MEKSFAGPNVMMGYFKDEQLTNEVIVDGYFHTGDIGEFDKDGFLKITDQKRNVQNFRRKIHCTTNHRKYGKNLVLLNKLVVGEGKNGAFIQTNFDFIKEWAAIHKFDIGSTNEEIYQ
jgi:long-chain acyl-CoA synthetase